MPTYFAILTDIGLQRLAEAQANYEPLVFTHLAVGDGDGSPITPVSSMTELVNEVERVHVNTVDLSPDEANTVRIEGFLPSSTGGYTIREAGAFNGDGELIAVASYPPIYKPVPADGVTVEEYIRILLVYSAVEAVALTTDPDVITATRLYVDALTHPVFFGTGADGDVSLNTGGGASPYSFMSKSGAIYHLLRDVHLRNLTMEEGTVLHPDGFDFRVLGTAVVPVNAVIMNDGDPGVTVVDTNGGAGGLATATGSRFGGSAGGDGGDANMAGNNGTASAKSGGGSGGDGGDSTGPAGGTGGAATDNATYGGLRSLFAILNGYRCGIDTGTATLSKIAGGAGGGGGGSNNAGTGGGGGGAGGGVITAGIRTLIIEGRISCDGGDGGDGSFGNDDAGGGGGGGGFIGLILGSRIGNGTITADGGAAGGAGATPASEGSDGTVVIYDLSLPQTELVSLIHVEQGKAIFTDIDEVEIEFANGWAYQNATGASGYSIIRLNAYVSDGAYGGVSVWIESKTTTGFVIKASGAFTGEVDWATEGV